jgi:uncharacterized membrane protein YhaH (DUF805 family)
MFSFIQCVKRMHDLGKSGWFVLIPFYNLMIFFDEGTKGSNAYGESLKKNFTEHTNGINNYGESPKGSNAHVVSAKGNDIENKDLLGYAVFMLFLLCGLYAFVAIIPGMISRAWEWLIIQFAK